MSEGFARRWTRLKRGSPAAAAPMPVPAPEETPPALETVQLDEIAGWLKRNVPQAWKAAALRRMWVEDAAIRGFVGLADYAWDWNTPGGAPFFGPMGAMDDLVALLERAMGTPAPPPAPAAPEQIAQQEPAAPAPAPEQPAREIVRGRRRGGGAVPV